MVRPRRLWNSNRCSLIAREDGAGEVLLYENGKPQAKTSHSLNPVPCIIYGRCWVFSSHFLIESHIPGEGGGDAQCQSAAIHGYIKRKDKKLLTRPCFRENEGRGKVKGVEGLNVDREGLHMTIF